MAETMAALMDSNMAEKKVGMTVERWVLYSAGYLVALTGPMKAVTKAVLMGKSKAGNLVDRKVARTAVTMAAWSAVS